MARSPCADRRSRAAAARVLPGTAAPSAGMPSAGSGRRDHGGSLGHGLSIAVGRCLADRLDGRARTTLLPDGRRRDRRGLRAPRPQPSPDGSARPPRRDRATPTATRASRPSSGPSAGSASRRASPPRAGTSPRSRPRPRGARRRAAAPAAGRPRLVVAHTVKGRGVSFMEGRFDSHYKSVRPHDRRAHHGRAAGGQDRRVRNAFAAALERSVQVDDRVLPRTRRSRLGRVRRGRAPGAPAASSTPASPMQAMVGVAAGWPRGQEGGRLLDRSLHRLARARPGARRRRRRRRPT
jgi:hypothetical protein